MCTPGRQQHDVVRHVLGPDHVIIRNVQTNGDEEIIMFTDRRATPRLAVVEEDNGTTLDR